MRRGHGYSGGQGSGQGPRAQGLAWPGMGTMARMCLSVGRVCRPTWQVSAGTAEAELRATVPPAVSPGSGAALLQVSRWSIS